MKDLFRRLRGADPYPSSVELPESSEDLAEEVRARIDAGRRPEQKPQASRGPLLAAAAAIAVIVVGVGAFLFVRGDDSAPVATSPTTVPETTVPETTTPSTTSPPTTATTTTIDSALPACTESAPELGEFLAFFADCGVGATAPYPVYRATDDDRTELALLLLGTTTREKARQLATGWDFLAAADRERLTVDAVLDSDDVLTLEFALDGETWTPGQLASSSSQLLSFLEPLQATVFATSPGIAAIDLSNLCWGEMGCGPAGSNVITRATWEGGLFVNHGVLHSPGCDLETYHFVDGCKVESARLAYDGTVVNVAPDDTLNVRSGPGVEYFEVTELPPDGRVLVYDVTDIATDGGRWQLVADTEGTFGWVNTAFIRPTSLLGDRTAEEQLVDAFVEFARNPNTTSFSELPLGAVVELGLGQELVASVGRDTLLKPSTWTIDIEGFAGYVGPFSSIDLLSAVGKYQVTVGEHQHCASPPRPAPSGYEESLRISIQPELGEQSSCLEWFTVDFFVDDGGDVQAITLDLWEP